MLLNDIHSQLNVTEVAQVERPRSLEELQAIVRQAASRHGYLSTSGGRHAMGGQQFATGSIHVDTTALNRVLGSDSKRGLLRIEAGADWPAIIKATHEMRTEEAAWGIRQKQTGVDAVTLGGSISANAHGRGLLMQPLGNDIEDLTVVNDRGEIVTCSRDQNPELFSLVIGGYGLFGVIYSATLRLTPRYQVKRMVDLLDLDDAVSAVFRRAREGCVFGDFQFAIDATDEGFLRRGVFACYKPSDAAELASTSEGDLSRSDWLRLIQLAHEDKRRAFQLYSEHYLATDGNHYWSDTHQLSTYIPSYADVLGRERAQSSGAKETLMIGEHYVPPDRLLEFMRCAREIIRQEKSEVIYGTIRSIRRDTVSFLPWAREDFACVIFNIRTRHDSAGVARTAATFRALIDASTALGGSFFLTYHRYASAAQIESCYPRFREFLDLKRRYDSAELFTSDWYAHYRTAFA